MSSGPPPTQPLERRTSATGTHISNFASKVTRALSPGRRDPLERQISIGGAMQSADLESQRGRQGVVSTGRGGAGNLLRSPSRGVDHEIIPGVERGREGSTQRDLSGDRAVRSGRGGVGNIRSPSRDPAARIAEEEKETSIQERLIAEQRGRQAEGQFSTGRGGAGNFSRDKSRSRSAVRGENGSGGVPVLAPPVNGSSPAHAHASGRGGWGNVREERESVDLEKEAAAARYEAGLAARYRSEDVGKVHSSGRHGAGNMSTKALSSEESARLNAEEQETIKKLQDKVTPTHYASGGRGGAGNYHNRDKDVAVDGERGRDGKTATHASGGILGSVMRSLSRAKGGSTERARD